MTVTSSVLKQMEDLKEETGLACCICREGYRYQPAKVIILTLTHQHYKRLDAIFNTETTMLREGVGVVHFSAGSVATDYLLFILVLLTCFYCIYMSKKCQWL